MQQANSNRLFSLLLYILGFLLFWEWLRPLVVIAKVTDLSYFVSFAAFSFFLSYLRLPIWISFPAKLIGVAYALHILFFYNTPFFSTLWLHYFYDDFTKNVSFMINGNWVGMTSLFRSFLFFLLLWIVSYLMQYWLIQVRKLFLFFFVTIVYLTVLDSFTMYHADGAIVRTMLIGLILIGLLRLLKIQENEQVSFKNGGWPLPWFVGLFSLVLLAMILGFAAPKVGAQWPDPVPFITKAANGYGGSLGGVGKVGQKIGYDANDTHLGGSFQMDNTLVFTGDSKYAHYWKIETKNTYTGKGWVNKPSNDYKTLNTLSGLQVYPALNAYGPQTQTEKITDSIHMDLSTFPQLVYGGDPLSVQGLNNDQLRLNQISGKLQPQSRGRFVTPNTYKMTFNYPTFSVPLLQKVKGNTQDPQAIKQTYLQLPKSLPVRVKQLAQQITAKKTNRYVKAEAIVTYLNGPDYSYNTTNVPVPGPNQDYVDQFLFESKRGYCDNFSTSMVVMLRSIGIPARWVKGFSQGTYQKTVNATTSEYQVRESDAHSWVEVYFPNSGWVPFEPTKGFSNMFQFNYTDQNAATPASTTPSNASSTPTKTTTPNQKQTAQQQNQGPGNIAADAGAVLSHVAIKFLFWVILAVLILIFIGLFLVIRYRRKWLPAWWKMRYSKRTDEETLDVAFDKLMKLLSLSGYQKKPEQTLREFAQDVDHAFGTSEMGELVRQMEKRRYFHAGTAQWTESRELWENMINRLRA